MQKQYALRNMVNSYCCQLTGTHVRCAGFKFQLLGDENRKIRFKANKDFL